MKTGFIKILATGICALITISSAVFAAGNEKYADALHSLGLFRGTDEGYMLSKPLSREESAAMIVRLTGVEGEVENAIYNVIFTDVPQSRWSFNYVTYCYINGITKGTGNETFTPAAEISAEEYTTLILRLLGYEAEPETAFSKAVECGLFPTKAARKFENSDRFLREDMTYISYRALKTVTSNGNTLAANLAKANVITEKQAEEFNIYNNDDISGIIDDLLE